ncbi:MAG: hypothetical protein GXP38_13120 [Chloroflexi bacterium]|nr:hypothetical protein [Chloroflexota bacterium]
MPAFKPDYTSFLIRLWREPQPEVGGSVAGGEWLVQIEHIPSGEQRYFASLEDCFAFIRTQTIGASANSGDEG